MEVTRQNGGFLIRLSAREGEHLIAAISAGIVLLTNGPATIRELSDEDKRAALAAVALISGAKARADLLAMDAEQFMERAKRGLLDVAMLGETLTREALGESGDDGSDADTYAV